MSSETRQPKAAQRPLPPGWRWVKLGEVCEFLDSRRIPVNEEERKRRISGKKQSQLFPYYGANGQVGWIDDYLFDEPLILLAEDGGNFGSTDKPIAYAVSGRYWVNNHAHVLKPRDGVIDFDYCLHAISIRPDVGDLVAGSTRAKLNQEIATTIPIPLPPLSEQKRIAGILREQMAAVERARRAAEEQLEAAQALPAAYLRAVFPKAGEPLPPGWRWVRLGEACEEQTGVHDPRREPKKPFRYVDISGVDNKAKRIIEARTLLGKDAPSRARQVIRSGDVLVSTTRPNLNAVAIVPTDLDGQVCSTGFCVLRAKASLDSDYLFGWVQTPDFIDALSALVKGALYPAVTDKQVRYQFLPLPPFAEQKRIAGILREQMASVERARQALEEQLEAINKLPAALLRKAFSGEL